MLPTVILIDTIRMKITKELVIAFFEDRCSKEEAEAVYKHLQENPQILRDYFPEEEWMEFNAVEAPTETWSEEVWEKIRPAKIRLIHFIRVAAAIVVIGSGVFAYRYYTMRAPQELVASTIIRDTTLTNNSPRPRRDTLTDGSVVDLYPGSSLRLRWNFEKDKRVITLSGEAQFNVQKDKTRPFTVLSKGIETTVLGTVFRIRDYAEKSVASVRLISGKVLVRNLIHPDQTEILLAGQECAFDNRKSTLTRIVVPKHLAAPTLELDQLADGAEQETETEILFRNLPLPKVLAALSRSYHTPIQFRNADLSNRSFTGSVQKTQSLEDALNSIAELNDLLVTEQDGSYRIAIRR